MLSPGLRHMAEDRKQEKTELYSEQDANNFDYSKEKFHVYFQQECSQMQKQIANLEESSLQVQKKQNAIDHILAGITGLSEVVADAGKSITAYNRRTYSQAIKGLEEKLLEAQARMTPKPRFLFKTRPKGISVDCARNEHGIAALENLSKSVATTEEPITEKYSSDMAKTNSSKSLGEFGHSYDEDLQSKDYNMEISQAILGIRRPSFSKAKSIYISDHRDIHIILPLSASQATSFGSIIQLTRCILDMSISTISNRPFASLVLRDIKSSLIIAGSVAGPIHITKAVDSVFVVASGQIRMHDCINTKMYIHCTSRPIIEDCTQIQFSPLPKCYTTFPQNSTKNQWDQVDDFNWLKSEPSPNWKKLAEEERIDETLWKDVISVSRGSELADILGRVGIQTYSDHPCQRS